MRTAASRSERIIAQFTLRAVVFEKMRGYVGWGGKSSEAMVRDDSRGPDEGGRWWVGSTVLWRFRCSLSSCLRRFSTLSLAWLTQWKRGQIHG